MTSTIIEYNKLNVKEMLPRLTKEDSMVSLPLKAIFALYDKPLLDLPLMHKNHKKIRNYSKINIDIYKLIDKKIHPYKSLISIARKMYDETIHLLAKDPAEYEEVGYL